MRRLQKSTDRNNLVLRNAVRRVAGSYKVCHHRSMNASRVRTHRSKDHKCWPRQILLCAVSSVGANADRCQGWAFTSRAVTLPSTHADRHAGRVSGQDRCLCYSVILTRVAPVMTPGQHDCRTPTRLGAGCGREQDRFSVVSPRRRSLAPRVSLPSLPFMRQLYHISCIRWRSNSIRLLLKVGTQRREL